MNMFLLSANHVPAWVILTFSFLWFHFPWQRQGPPTLPGPPASTQASPCLWRVPRSAMLTVLLGCAWPVLLNDLTPGTSYPFSWVGSCKPYITTNIFWNPEQRSRRAAGTSFWNCGSVGTREPVTQWAGSTSRGRNRAKREWGLENQIKLRLVCKMPVTRSYKIVISGLNICPELPGSQNKKGKHD